jgi:large subunit ribosomal protein L25
MQLEVFERKDEKIPLLRRKGYIPAVVYSKGKQGSAIYIEAHALRQILNGIKGKLATTIFTLTIGKEKFQALIKEVQYHVATYDILHVDFLQLSKEAVEVNVPITFTGVAECSGVKLGGFLRQVIRSVKVKCLPEHIPQEFTVDVSGLNMMQSKRLSDIAMPKNVELLVKNKEAVIVRVAKAQQ